MSVPCPEPFQLNDDGSCTLTLGEKIVDKHGHELEGDHDPKAKNGCDHRDTPEWKKEHRVSQNKQQVVQPEETPDLSPAPQETVATVGVPEGLPDLKAIIPADGKITGTTVAMAAVAVAGSGAVLKLVKNWMDGRKELEEKRLELEQQKAEEKKDDHQQCSASRIVLEQRIAELIREQAELREQIRRAADRSAMLPSNFDPEELIERIEALEGKKAKSAPKKTRGRK